MHHAALFFPVFFYGIFDGGYDADLHLVYSTGEEVTNVHITFKM